MHTSGIGYGILSFIGIFVISRFLNSLLSIHNVTVGWAFIQSTILILSTGIIAFLLAKKTRAYRFPWTVGIISAIIYLPILWFTLMFSEYVVTRDGRIPLILLFGLISMVVVIANILKKVPTKTLQTPQVQPSQSVEKEVLSKRFFYVGVFVYVISLIFIVSGALNLGFSGFWMATPFMVLAIHFSKKLIENRKLYWFTVIFSIGAIFFNITIEKNPLIFPILIDGYVEIQRDGYQVTYDDGSGGFRDHKQDEIQCIGCGPRTYTKVEKGDIYKVEGIKIGHPDFGIDIRVLTEIGEFGEHNFDQSDVSSRLYHDENGELPVKLNKNVTRFGQNTGILMMWPVFPMMLLSFMQ